MKTSVQRWGNSLAVRIPKSFAIEIGVGEDSPIEISLRDGHLLVSPLPRPQPTLEDLLAKVTEENRHAEVEVEGPLGREAW
jgi:antitoxin MazE